MYCLGGSNFQGIIIIAIFKWKLLKIDQKVTAFEAYVSCQGLQHVWKWFADGVLAKIKTIATFFKPQKLLPFYILRYILVSACRLIWFQNRGWLQMWLLKCFQFFLSQVEAHSSYLFSETYWKIIESKNFKLREGLTTIEIEHFLVAGSYRKFFGSYLFGPITLGNMLVVVVLLSGSELLGWTHNRADKELFWIGTQNVLLVVVIDLLPLNIMSMDF